MCRYIQHPLPDKILKISESPNIQLMNTDIDRIDRKILRALQDDGRIANVDLAKQIGLSPTACLERVKRLTRDGFIEGYGARLNPELLDAGLLVFVEVVLDRTTPEVFERFKQAVLDRPEVQECHMVAGGFDYLIKARVRDMKAYRDLLGSTLLSLPGVRETHTYAVMEEVKHETAIHIPPA
jgi:Lrp/AsnC family leucine-responsive transcriptional regulator